MESNNQYGLSKKTNVAIAAITGLTVAANADVKQAIIAMTCITAISFCQLYIQGKIDFYEAKKSNKTITRNADKRG